MSSDVATLLSRFPHVPYAPKAGLTLPHTPTCFTRADSSACACLAFDGHPKRWPRSCCMMPLRQASKVSKEGKHFLTTESEVKAPARSHATCRGLLLKVLPQAPASRHCELNASKHIQRKSPAKMRPKSFINFTAHFRTPKSVPHIGAARNAAWMIQVLGPNDSCFEKGQGAVESLNILVYIS